MQVNCSSFFFGFEERISSIEPKKVPKCDPPASASFVLKLKLFTPISRLFLSKINKCVLIKIDCVCCSAGASTLFSETLPGLGAQQ